MTRESHQSTAVTVTTASTNGVASDGSTSDAEQLRKALADSLAPSYGSDDQPPVGGMQFRETAWQLPAVITEGMCAEAERMLGETQRMNEPAEKVGAVRWLASLGLTVAGAAIRAEDANAKAEALWMVLEDFPAGCFTKATLKRAVAKFLGFPSGQELVAFLKDEQRRIRTRDERLMAIVATGPRELPRWSKAKEAEWREKLRIEREEERKRLLAAMEAFNSPDVRDTEGFKAPPIPKVDPA
jgi:hypothetical protein